MKSFDPDTRRILEIAHHFLMTEFGHEEAGASELLERLLEQHGSVFDEDFIHYESSFGVAAAAHYFGTLGGTPATLRSWRRETGISGTPARALEYFRRHYFRNNA